ncbi:hypothetical protein Dimus_017144 [Dionaea muscipula]
MACLDMYNSEHKGLTGSGRGGASMSPRISFSNDFAEAHAQGKIIKQERGNRELGPISTDFEFSVSGNSMMTADELFSKGRLLPLKQRAASSTSTTDTGFSSTTTLRNELLDDDEDDDNRGGFSLKPSKGSSRWKSFLGLRKSHIGSKKPEKKDGLSMERSTALEPKRSAFSFDHPPNARRSSQDTMMDDEGPNNKDTRTWS